MTDRWRRAARSAHAINAGMSNDGTDHPAVIAHGSLSPQVGPAAHFAAGETRSATGPVPDILENPLLPLILSSHPHAGKKVRISTGVHTLPARRGKRSARSTASPLASALAAVAFRLANGACSSSFAGSCCSASGGTTSTSDIFSNTTLELQDGAVPDCPIYPRLCGCTKLFCRGCAVVLLVAAHATSPSRDMKSCLMRL